ncbi:MAG: xanthine dehydrogenase family protein molybdopterin-binding subunit, partial [Halobacteriaceae archaeon]
MQELQKSKESESDEKDTIGEEIPRREDVRLLTGNATFTDDYADEELSYLAFVRSDVAHADIDRINTENAQSIEGVIAIYTWTDIESSDIPGEIPISTGALDHDVPGHPILARDRVRYQGQPIAAVIAEDRYVAHDGAQAVEISYDNRPAVVDPNEAQKDSSPILYDEVPNNVIATKELGDKEKTDQVFDTASNIVQVDLQNNRLIPNALEPRAALAEYDSADDELTVTMTSQSPHGHRRKLSHTLGMPEQKIRVVSPSVGGG